MLKSRLHSRYVCVLGSTIKQARVYFILSPYQSRSRNRSTALLTLSARFSTQVPTSTSTSTSACISSSNGIPVGGECDTALSTVNTSHTTSAISFIDNDAIQSGAVAYQDLGSNKEKVYFQVRKFTQDTEIQNDNYKQPEGEQWKPAESLNPFPSSPIVPVIKNTKDTSGTDIDLMVTAFLTTKIARRIFLKSPYSNLLRIMLPKDYPTSVTTGYAEYTKWAFIQMVVGSASFALANQSLLLAAGVGRELATPVTATILLTLKDQVGPLFAIAFGSSVNVQFDSNAKRWRMFSVILVDAGLCLDILTQSFSNHFFVLATIAGIAKYISMSASSASRTGLHRSFQRRENMADITARAVSQSNLANIIGGAAGVLISWVVAMKPSSVLVIFFALSCTSMYVSYRSLSAVPLRSLSSDRAEKLVLEVLHCYKLRMENYHSDGINIESITPRDYINVPSPLSINKTDPFIRRYQSPLASTSSLQFAPAFDELLASFIRLFGNIGQTITSQVHLLKQFYSPYPFYVSVSPAPETKIDVHESKSFFTRVNHKTAPYVVMLLYESRATSEDVMLGFLFATTVRNSIKTWLVNSGINPNNAASNFELDIVQIRSIIIDALAFIRKVGSEFTRQLRDQEWLVDHVHVEPDSQARVRVYNSDELDSSFK